MICTRCAQYPARKHRDMCDACIRELAAGFTDRLRPAASITIGPLDVARIELEQESEMERDRR